jgi:drug/metabolite transporter (DMT)-like permease
MRADALPIMFPAFLTTILFSISAITANRSVSQLGSDLANASRLAFAAVVLGAGAFWLWEFPGLAIILIFVISGVVGFGFGDIGVFYALPRLGSRLCILYTQCVAAPIAGLIEWFWLGTELTSTQVFWSCLTLVGVVIALKPTEAKNFDRKKWLSGSLFGLLAATGQAGGAVISRYGYNLLESSQEELPAISAAFLRVSGGLVVAAIAFFLLHKKRNITLNRSIGAFIILNAMAGPVLGVSCYQWALSSQPSFIVLPIVALCPIVVIPFAMIWENDKPSLQSLLGALLAVASAIFLTLATLNS